RWCPGRSPGRATLLPPCLPGWTVRPARPIPWRGRTRQVGGKLMAAAAGSDLLSRMDAAPVSGRYWLVLALISTQLLTEMFDFFIASFLVSALAPLWKLTFGQTAIMLLSAGVGAIVGAVLFGW